MKASFNQLIASEIPVLVDFHAEWCGPCKTMAPILKQLKDSAGARIKIIKIDVDRNPAIAGRYQVRGVPTLVLFKNGQAVWRQSGVVPIQALTQAVTPFL
ncbi:thioredoxin [Robiginitalea sediminis]|uniref:thioredoxin n=1 Tax=Robiginitalea sediminis TaxID=1982593 RepID=UPI000B4C00B3|nr:thioredoxin [Robiginitalea sediminis]